MHVMECTDNGPPVHEECFHDTLCVVEHPKRERQLLCQVLFWQVSARRKECMLRMPYTMSHVACVLVKLVSDSTVIANAASS